MEIIIPKSWHKVNGDDAMTYGQLLYIDKLRTAENCEGWDFPSKTNAMRSLTKLDAAKIIATLVAGNKVIIQ